MMNKVLRVLGREAAGYAIFASEGFYRTPQGNRYRKRWDITGGKRLYVNDTSKNIVNSPLGEVKIPEVLFHEYIFENWGLWEGKVAVECVRSGKKFSFKHVMRYSKALAAGFQNKLNVSKGDKIALILPNCPEFPVAVLASSQSGVIPTTVNPNYTVDEISKQLKDSEAKLLITDTKTYEKCVSAVQLLKASFPILVVRHTRDDDVPPGAIDLFELFDHSISGEFKPVDVQMDDTLVLPYSSGTTGGPKGVLLSHRNIVSNLSQLNHPETNIISPTTWFSQDRVFAVLPMFHIFGMVASCFFSLRDGCRVIILPKFNPLIFIRNLYLKKVNILYLVPPILRLLGNEKVKPKYLKRLKYIINGASAFAISDAHTIMEKAEHVKIVQGYGLTETSPVLTHTSAQRLQQLSSIGIAIASTKLKVVDPETGEPLPMGKQGELCAWGPQVMKSYLNRPEETKNAFDKDGWFKTGDMAYYDENKDFFIVQRMKDLIKVKGFQVAPLELEEIIKSHPKIVDVAVVGVPHPDYGEVPRAFVILQEGAEMTEEEVKNLVRKKLSNYKHLTGGVKFMTDFPKNQMGKVLRLELKKM